MPETLQRRFGTSLMGTEDQTAIDGPLTVPMIAPGYADHNLFQIDFWRGPLTLPWPWDSENKAMEELPTPDGLADPNKPFPLSAEESTVKSYVFLAGFILLAVFVSKKI